MTKGQPVAAEIKKVQNTITKALLMMRDPDIAFDSMDVQILEQDLEESLEPIKNLKIAPPQAIEKEEIKLKLAKMLIEEGKKYDYSRHRYPESYHHLLTAVEAFDQHLELIK